MYKKRFLVANNYRCYNYWKNNSTFVTLKVDIMCYSIYYVGDGSMMTQDDVIGMLIYYLNAEDYKDWSFDDITGGETEFICYEYYNEMKSIFQKLKK